MAWAEKLSSGKWRGCWRDPSGRQHHTRRPEFPEHPYGRKSDAKAAGTEAEVKARRLAAAEAGTLSPRTPWGEWWDLIKDRRVTEDTSSDRMELNTAERYLRPRWGDVPLNKIAQKKVQRWVDDWAAGKITEWTHKRKPEPSSVRRSYAVFRWSMQQAIDDDVLTASPCAGVRLPKIPKKRKPHLTVTDATVIGRKMRWDYRDFMDFEHETGLRPSELAGLHADAINWDRRVIEVHQVYVVRKGVVRAWPKDKDARVVPLTAKAAAIARRHMDDRDLTAGCGLPHSDGSTCESVLVFLTARDKPIHPEVFAVHMKAAATEAKVAKKTPYAARRGAATRLADGGADAFAIKEFMGHATVEQSDQYVQQTEQSLAKLRAAMGDPRTLEIVPGASGADRGADPEKQATQSDATQPAGKVM